MLASTRDQFGHGAKHLLAQAAMVISQTAFSGVSSEPRMTFAIRKTYREDSQDDAIMSQWPGCEIIISGAHD
jgi:hypothetical protein